MIRLINSGSQIGKADSLRGKSQDLIAALKKLCRANAVAFSQTLKGHGQLDLTAVHSYMQQVCLASQYIITETFYPCDRPKRDVQFNQATDLPSVEGALESASKLLDCALSGFSRFLHPTAEGVLHDFSEIVGAPPSAVLQRFVADLQQFVEVIRNAVEVSPCAQGNDASLRQALNEFDVLFDDLGRLNTTEATSGRRQ